MAEYTELHLGENVSVNNQVAGQLSVSTEGYNEQDDNAVEAHIRRSEEALGLTTTPQRLIEAGLFIDKKFLDTAIITGQPSRPERIFGSKEWLGHLAARLCARQHGNQPLTTDFVLALHQLFLDAVGYDEMSEIVDGEGGRGAQYVDGRFSPITCTDAQVTAVNSNPFLRFEATEPDVPNVGFIRYATMSRQERVKHLHEICADYNAESRVGGDPYCISSKMQHRFVSLHPVSFDFRGRTSRVLMNWALENAGESPSIVDDVDGDLFLPEDKWADSVRLGSSRYAGYQRKAEAGVTDPVALFGLEREKLRYDTLLETAGIHPPSLVGSDWHDHSQSEKFLAKVRTSA